MCTARSAEGVSEDVWRCTGYSDECKIRLVKMMGVSWLTINSSCMVRECPSRHSEQVSKQMQTFERNEEGGGWQQGGRGAEKDDGTNGEEEASDAIPSLY